MVLVIPGGERQTVFPLNSLIAKVNLRCAARVQKTVVRRRWIVDIS